jgi:hypothetical protein
LPQPGRVTTEISLEDQQVLRRAAEILGTTVHELPHKIPSALNEASENVLPTPASQPGTLAYAPAFQVASSQQADEDLFRNTDFSWPADFYSPMSGHGVPVSDTCFRLFEPAYDSSQMPHPPAFYPSHAQPQFQVDRDSAGWDSPLDVFASSQYASGDMQFPPQQGANSMNWNSAPGGNSLLESWLLNPDPASLRAFEPLLNDTAAINSDSYGTLTDARVSSSALASAPTGPPATGVHASKSNADNSGNNNLVLELATSDSLSGTEQGSSATEHSGSGTERGRSKGLSARPGSASASHESSRSPVPEPRAENWSRQPRRRGPFHDPVEREQTGLTRQLGACIRCRIQKARVSNT